MNNREALSALALQPAAATGAGAAAALFSAFADAMAIGAVAGAAAGDIVAAVFETEDRSFGEARAGTALVYLETQRPLIAIQIWSSKGNFYSLLPVAQ